MVRTVIPHYGGYQLYTRHSHGEGMSHGIVNLTPRILPAGSSKKIVLVLGILALSLLVATASAHPPSDMTLQYQSGELDVTITHGVADPAVHFVYRVNIAVNGVPADTFLYSSQPSENRFSYRYPVNAAPGDTIEVTAACNIAGSITRQLVVGGGSGQETPVPVLWPYHALLQTLGFIFLFSAVLAVRFGRKIPGWYRWHKHLAYAGGILILAAFAIAVYMVAISGGPHIRVPHAASGVFTIVLVFLTLFLGVARERVRPPRPYLRTIHLSLGLITVLFLTGTIILGLITAGVF
jgi:hypothetical protein